VFSVKGEGGALALVTTLDASFAAVIPDIVKAHPSSNSARRTRRRRAFTHRASKAWLLVQMDRSKAASLCRQVFKRRMTCGVQAIRSVVDFVVVAIIFDVADNVVVRSVHYLFLFIVIRITVSANYKTKVFTRKSSISHQAKRRKEGKT
jgi:hypothetical protein